MNKEQTSRGKRCANAIITDAQEIVKRTIKLLQQYNATLSTRQGMYVVNHTNDPDTTWTKMTPQQILDTPRAWGELLECIKDIGNGIDVFP